MSKFICQKCKTTGADLTRFDSRSQVFEHLKKKHGLVAYHCVQCNEEFEDEKTHRNYHAVFPFPCPFCWKHFAAKSGLSVHMKSEHSREMGLHNPAAGVTINADTMPCRGDALMLRVSGLGFPAAMTKLSKDFFVICKEGSLPRITVHALTNRATVAGVQLSTRNFKNIQSMKGHQLGHLASAADFVYDENAYIASYDADNWVYMENSLNNPRLRFLEDYTRNNLAPRWDDILIVTALNYKDGCQVRLPAVVGKALIMTRAGESTRVLCFALKNEPFTLSFWHERLSLEKFREKTNMPDFLAEIPNVIECGKEEIYQCEFVRCHFTSDNADARNAHVQQCSIKSDPKAKKRTSTLRLSNVFCTHCKYLSHCISNVDKHNRIYHEDGGTQRKKNHAANTNMERERSRSPIAVVGDAYSVGESGSSSSSIWAKPDMSDGAVKVATLIQETPLTQSEVEQIMDVLLTKTPTDAVE